tara:strand:- start:5253 stop:6452 length:1200 start_codon:yes stop_codon:yes gene_type:complete
MTLDHSLQSLCEQGFSLKQWLPVFPHHDLNSLNQICSDYRLSLQRSVSRGGFLLSTPVSTTNYNYKWPGFRLNSINGQLLDVNYNRNAFNIFIFGGSAVHGCYLPDNETVCSHLQSLCNSIAPTSATEVSIYNCSANNWTLENSYSFFRTLLLQGYIPDLVICLFGVNDAKNFCWQSDISHVLNSLYLSSKSRTDFTIPGPSYLSSHDFSNADTSVCSNFFGFTQLLNQSLDESTALGLRYLATYTETLNSVFRMHVKSIGASYFGALQPIPSYNNSSKLENEVLCQQSLFTNIDAIRRINYFYSFCQSRKYQSAKHFRFPSPTSSSYLDFCHYSPFFSNLISQYIMKKIKPIFRLYRFKRNLPYIFKPKFKSPSLEDPSSMLINNNPLSYSDSNYPLY